MRLTFVAVLFVLGHSDAQSWSISAHAPWAGTATVSITPLTSPTITTSATLPVGPVPQGTFLTCNASVPQPGGQGGVVMSWIPSVVGSSAPLAFSAHSDLGCVGLWAPVSAAGAAVIDLTLRAPQPVGGRLVVRVSGFDYATGLSSAFSRIDLDVDADGIIEVSAYEGVASTPLDVPLQIPATGAVIRLTFNSSSSAVMSLSSQSTQGSRTIQAQFFPGEPAVAPFATFIGAATMSVNHSYPGTVTLSIAGPGLMAFGGTALSVPWLPYVTVLVSPDVLISTTGSITLPLPPLPPGALYAQGLVLDSVGTLRGTNSVRFLWL